MAVNEITELAKDDENKPIIMKFAPWNYSDKDNLISMFFQSLKNKINVQDNEELKNKVGKALSDYAGAFDALCLLHAVWSNRIRLHGKSDIFNNICKSDHIFFHFRYKPGSALAHHSALSRSAVRNNPSHHTRRNSEMVQAFLC